MNKHREKAKFRDKELDIKLRDEWDFLTSCLRQPDCPCALTRSNIVEYLLDSKFASRGWLEKWLMPRAAFLHGENPINLELLTLRLKKLILEQAKHKSHSSDAERFKEYYKRYRRTFYKKAYSLPDRGFKFVGREKELNQISRYFSVGKNVVTLSAGKRAPTKTLRGFGGQGKTSIAHQYATLNRTSYAGVLWIDAQDLDMKQTLLKDALENFRKDICHKYDIFDHKYNNSESISYILETISELLRGFVLIIIDNIPLKSARPARFDEENDDVKHEEEFNTKISQKILELVDAVPSRIAVRYNFLITSRRELLPDRIVNMAINRLTQADAAELFRVRSGYKELDVHNPSLVRLVDDVLGGHALSIALIASFANQKKVEDVDKLISIIESRIDNTSEFDALALDQAEYPLSLQASILVSFESIPRQSHICCSHLRFLEEVS